MNTDRFYADLPALGDFNAIAQPEQFVDVPADWHVAVADVRGSTQAVRQGRYKDVNLLGASSIIAVLNAVRPLAIPYIFGGDGATMCIPPSLLASTRNALLATQKMAREEFNLQLRIGMVPVQYILDSGFAVRIACLRTSDQLKQAAFTGGGIQFAERCVKDEARHERFGIMPGTDSIKADFSGLECRWDAIPSAHGEIVTLLVQAVSNDSAHDAQTYRDVLLAIADIYGGAEFSRPAAPQQMKLSLDSRKLRGEALVRFAGKAALLKAMYILLVKFQLLLGRLFIDKGWHVAGIDWRQYKQDVIANTDYRKFDDVLRYVLSGTTDQRRQLAEFLEKKYQNGDLVYGTHVAPTAIMTCLIFQRDGGHVHFVDGSDGGYTMAAADLKQRLSCRNHSGHNDEVQE